MGGMAGVDLRTRFGGSTGAGAGIGSSFAAARPAALTGDLGFAGEIFPERAEAAAFFLGDDSFDFITHSSS
jgi:hypothetical protein